MCFTGTTLKFSDAQQYTVIVDVVVLEKFSVGLELLGQQISLLLAQVDDSFVIEPVAVFEGNRRTQFLVGVLAASASICGPLEVVPNFNILIRVEHVCHDHEVDALDTGRPSKLDLVEANEARDHGVRVGKHVVVIVLHDRLEVLKLVMRDCLQHVEPICCVVKQRARLSC